MAMTRAARPRGCRRACRQATAALRFCAALWLVFYTAYTPIHLYLEPHSNAADSWESALPAAAADWVADPGHEGDEHHERHPAAQHTLKVTQPVRVALAEMVPVQTVEWVHVEPDCSMPPVFGFSGLSPPELARCWQFFFRAALPVRAPSLIS